MRLPPEKRSQGPLIAMIDLLWLVLCFFLLLIFFMQQNKSTAQAQLEQVQDTITRVTGVQAADLPKVVKALEPVLKTFMVQQREEAERQRELSARELRKEQRETVRLSYQILPGSQVVYEGRAYTPPQFKAQVVDPLRADKWVAFRAIARAETPFGEVVAIRRVLLEKSGEFDTYWDNVTQQNGGPGERSR